MTIPYTRHHHREPAPGAAALEVANLAAGYPGGGVAIRDITFTLPPGKRLALVGPNGAGKSTLLKAIAGLLQPAAGSIRIYGHPVGVCRHRVSYLSQKGDVDWRFPIDVRRLVTTGRYVHLGWFRLPGSKDKRIVEEVMAKLRIADLAARQIGELSGGQQQRALLARALAQEAELLLLDEPTTAVDVDTRQILSTVLDEIQKQGKTIVVATHDHGRRESEYDQFVYLREGRQVEIPDEDAGQDHHHDHAHEHDGAGSSGRPGQ